MRRADLEQQLAAARQVIEDHLLPWTCGDRGPILLSSEFKPYIRALCKQFSRLDEAEQKRLSRAGRKLTGPEPTASTLRSRKHRAKQKQKGQ